ncbi:hypothetical protein JOQ06_027952 [Pogonophryne albipinna]|uniref:Uncharacterized protein n=1 Tax=Pogonophryne albipinna TaxID=1090488 RepID=A0AAD6AA10_9TELE|nr:hypothetical protein JOQ06_027952 [Pogonophryne albipinna]
MQTPDPPTEHDPNRGELECEMKSDSSPERDHAHDDYATKEAELAEKKRKRKPYRPGIGGFMVRQRGGKSGPSRIKLCRKDSSERLPGGDEDVSMETAPAADQSMEKVKKRYRKKKTKLEEEFPSYLQVTHTHTHTHTLTHTHSMNPSVLIGCSPCAGGVLRSDSPGSESPSRKEARGCRRRPIRSFDRRERPCPLYTRPRPLRPAPRRHVDEPHQEAGIAA